MGDYLSYLHPLLVALKRPKISRADDLPIANSYTTSACLSRTKYKKVICLVTSIQNLLISQVFKPSDRLACKLAF